MSVYMQQLRNALTPSPRVQEGLEEAGRLLSLGTAALSLYPLYQVAKSTIRAAADSGITCFRSPATLVILYPIKEWQTLLQPATQIDTCLGKSGAFVLFALTTVGLGMVTCILVKKSTLIETIWLHSQGDRAQRTAPSKALPPPPGEAKGKPMQKLLRTDSRKTLVPDQMSSWWTKAFAKLKANKPESAESTTQESWLSKLIQYVTPRK